MWFTIKSYKAEMFSHVDFSNEIKDLIPNPIDQNPWAHWRSPMDMMRQG
jgi:hypothetical protein